MSDSTPFSPISPEDRDLLAAEYVLGLLRHGESEAFEAWAERDRSVALAVEFWERCLDPLSELVAPVAPPPEAWHRIALATGMAPQVVAWRTIWRAAVYKLKPRWLSWHWVGNNFAAAMVGAAIAYATLLPRMQAIPALAVLGAPGTEAPGYLVRIDKDNHATIVAHAVKPEEGRVLVLWGRPEGQDAPIFLAVLPMNDKIRMPAGVGVGATLLVSSEPAGGPPNPEKPTGPVVYEGTFVKS